MKRKPPAQRILEDQGYLIVAYYVSGLAKIGTVLERLNGGFGYAAIPGPLVIVGTATREQWGAQHHRYSKTHVQRPSHAVEFWKVVAE